MFKFLLFIILAPLILGALLFLVVLARMFFGSTKSSRKAKNKTTEAEVYARCPNCGQQNSSDSVYCKECGCNMNTYDGPVSAEVVYLDSSPKD